MGGGSIVFVVTKVAEPFLVPCGWKWPSLQYCRAYLEYAAQDATRFLSPVQYVADAERSLPFFRKILSDVRLNMSLFTQR